ncbi:MAG: hypothetical protein JSU85_14160 [Candidatus Zixiibacteriota bacterium]|nr:MAG: hypothetical protein JSU85_14160 [candidate division Zixibacteria bacterium]
MKITTQGEFSVLFIMATAVLLYSCSFKPSPKKIVEDMISVKNTHQVTASLEYFADDALLEIPKMGIKMEGKEGRRAIAEYDSVLNTILAPSNFAISGDTVFCSVTEHNDWIEAAEIPDAYYPRVMFVVKDNKISYNFAELADSSKENFERVLDHFVFWGNDKYPEKMKTMAPEGDFIYNAENGIMVVDMLREWKAEQKQGKREPVSGRMPKRLDKNK